MSQKIVYPLQAGRGIAAIAVILFHAEGAINQFFNTKEFVFFAFGDAGVHFFFVVSGFIIARSHRSDIGQPNALRSYVLRRLFRILPLFWLIMAVYGLKAFFMNQWDSVYFLKSIFLIPMPELPLLVQSWTLTHEFIFYGLFSICILYGYRAYGIIGLWFFLILVNWYFVGVVSCYGVQSCIWGALLRPINLLFGFGLLAELISRRGERGVLLVLFYFGLIYLFVLILLSFFDYGLDRDLLDVLGYGLASFFLVCGVSALRVAPRVQIVFSWLGDLSYAAYLIHGAVISVAISLTFKVTDDRGLVYICLIPGCVVLTLLFSHLINRFFEVPMAKMVAHLTRKPSSGLQHNQ